MPTITRRVESGESRVESHEFAIDFELWIRRYGPSKRLGPIATGVAGNIAVLTRTLVAVKLMISLNFSRTAALAEHCLDRL
jgi:hypothetical protein